MAENPWYYVTLLGEVELWKYFLAVLIIMYFVLGYVIERKGRQRLWYRNFLILLLISLLVSYGVVTITKEVLHIPRPCIPCSEGIADCNPYCTSDFSFPSGHATIGFVAFTSLFLMLRRPKFLTIYIIPLLIAASRVFLGVHTLIDMAGGALIGIIVPYLVFIALKNTLKTPYPRPKPA